MKKTVQTVQIVQAVQNVGRKDRKGSDTLVRIFWSRFGKRLEPFGSVQDRLRNAIERSGAVERFELFYGGEARDGSSE
jgi:hypothetical protein